MDSEFIFPRPSPAVPRPPRPAATQPAPAEHPDAPNRDSNALRASVLETALALGIGNNTTVTNWMFNNAVTEEDEEEEQQSPGLTSGSTATSESSHGGDIIYSTPKTPPMNPVYPTYTTPYGAGAYGGYAKFQPVSGGIEASMWSPGSIPGPTGEFVPFPRPPTPTRNKLKKKRTADGYESDGGYASDSLRKRKEKERKKKDGSAELAEAKVLKEEKKRLKEESKAAERTRKKSAIARNAPSLDDLKNPGYETDGGGISSRKTKSRTRKAPSSADGYETDEGYMSSSGKKKKSFFKRSNKKSDASAEELPPRVSREPPTIPPLPLPIAERFASAKNEPSPVISSDSATVAAPTPLSRPPPTPLTSHEAQVVSAPATLTTSGSYWEEDDEDESVSSHSHSATAHSHARLGPPSQFLDLSDSNSANSSRSVSPYGHLKPSDSSLVVGRSEFQPHPPIQAHQGRHIPSPLSLQPGHAWDGPRSVSPSGSPSFPLHSINTNVSRSASHLASGRGSPLPPGSGRASPLHPSDSPGGEEALSPDERHLSQQTIVPSTDFLVPSPLHSPLPRAQHDNEVLRLPSPSRANLASYDMPPPSPPPSSPLPARPSGNRSTPSPLTHKSSSDYLDDHGNVQHSGQRGRTSPFPSRPVVSPQNSSSPLDGFEARIKIPRYRGLYAMPSPRAGWESQTQKGVTGEGVRWKHESKASGPGIQVEEPSDDEAEVDELRDALMGRFEKPTSDEEQGSWKEAALDRSHSWNLRKMERRMAGSRAHSPTSDPEDSSLGHGSRGTMNNAEDTSPRDTQYSDNTFGVYEGGEETNRISRWSGGSVYSRSSFIDAPKSDEMRDRLVQRVEVMYDENRRELGPGIGRRGVPSAAVRFESSQPRTRRPIEKF